MRKGLASRVSHLKPSPTLTITAKAKELRAKGVDVIGFGAGEPDFDTPDFIKEACIRALREGKTKYAPSAGIPELREAIAEKLLKENKVEYKPSEIVVSAGAKMVLFLIFMAILDEGDEVLLPSPYWVTYPEQIRFFGGVPVEVPLKKEKGFQLSLEDVKEKVTERTKAIVINSPNNPTGAVYEEEELKKIAEFCVERGIFIISDECYEYFVYGDAKFVSPASFSDEVKNITFTVNAFSKSYSMTGWRIGYVACPEEYAKVIASLNSQSVSNVTTFAQYGALEALKNPKSKDFVNEMRNAFERRRDTAVEELSKIPGMDVVKPEGAFYIFPDFSAYAEKLGGDVKLSEFLLEKAKVAVVPGSAFGAPGFLRLSYALSEERLVEGIRRIKKALEEI
ncbi:pyridoxal phosphate-dependent aminotransferase [Aquifex aeolicus]|uniref:Probable aspartate/prephenate aminotransferase n=1 Tax=Aquifex aeolicus (strain VF5) TaxID=224324 RepID=AAPAT_AQUAE|nr:pyridoxal phosphate-dependent aminotransferase [Aquifex aeolicus]O67781.1 RecName: Full=Probable aspartate/prephenate aminotransferase; Short=AspAT / PAT; AltName: Full=Transaminase A [Aquifex aeolicus VF5]AAC07746.1 aspartate aminotransferase [Aquifex aeolicus VF5]